MVTLAPSMVTAASSVRPMVNRSSASWRCDGWLHDRDVHESRNPLRTLRRALKTDRRDARKKFGWFALATNLNLGAGLCAS